MVDAVLTRMRTQFGLQREWKEAEFSIPEPVWFAFYTSYLLPKEQRAQIQSVTFPPWALGYLIKAALKWEKEDGSSSRKTPLHEYVVTWLGKEKCEPVVVNAVKALMEQLEGSDVCVVSSWLFVMGAPSGPRELKYDEWLVAKQRRPQA